MGEMTGWRIVRVLSIFLAIIFALKFVWNITAALSLLFLWACVRVDDCRKGFKEVK